MIHGIRPKFWGPGMHQTLAAIQQHLEKLITQVRSAVPNDEPFGNAHNNWSFPGLTRAELIEEAQSILDLIEAKGSDDLNGDDARLKDYVRRLQHLQSTAAQLWGNSAQAVPAYMLTLDGLRKALMSALTDDARLRSIDVVDVSRDILGLGRLVFSDRPYPLELSRGSVDRPVAQHELGRSRRRARP